MDYVLAAIGSVTTAVRLRKKAESMGTVKAAVVHTPSVINKGGCSYSLRFPKEYVATVKRASEKADIPIKGIYAESRERGWHALP